MFIFSFFLFFFFRIQKIVQMEKCLNMNDINISSKFAPKNKILSPYCASKSNKPQEILTLDESQQEKGTTKVKGANVLELNMIFGQKKKNRGPSRFAYTHIENIYIIWMDILCRERQTEAWGRYITHMEEKGVIFF